MTPHFTPVTKLFIVCAAFAALLLAVQAHATVMIPASINNAALSDGNGDDVGDSVFAPSSGSIAVGEQNGTPPATAELRYWLPFELSASERAAVLSGASVLLDVQFNQKQNVGAFNVDLVGLPGRVSSTAVAGDYEAAGATLVDNALTSATPVGRTTFDITTFAKAEALTPGSVLALRLENDQPALLPDGDGVRNNYIVNSQNNTNAFLRPRITVVPAHVLLFDDFNNDDLAMGGINGGFELVTNSAGGAGTASEADTRSTVATTGGNNDNSGLVSLNTFDPTALSHGFAAQWVVTAAENPSANGINLSIQSGNGFFNDATGRPNLLFRFDNSDGNDFQLRANDGASEIILFEDTSINLASVLDGFTVNALITPEGWAYTIEGITGLDKPTNAGYWTASHNYNTLFDATTFIGAFIQKGSGTTAASQRELSLDSITVTVNVVPEPATATLGLLGVLLLARRRRRAA